MIENINGKIDQIEESITELKDSLFENKEMKDEKPNGIRDIEKRLQGFGTACKEQISELLGFKKVLRVPKRNEEYSKWL